jgi:CheY-like chemotaxis protein
MSAAREQRRRLASASAEPGTRTRPSRTSRRGPGERTRPPGRRRTSPRGQVHDDVAGDSHVPASNTVAASDQTPQAAPGDARPPTEDTSSAYADVMVVDGMSVVEAGDGQAAHDLLRTTRVGVLVLDLHMTPRDGVWLLEQLRNPPAVMMVSAFSHYSEGDMRRRFSSIVTHFVQKPVAPAKLIDLVRANLDAGTA